MYTYDDYDVINESALDMAMDMSDRYGVAIEDAYDFMCDAMEGSLKDPRKRTLREIGRREIANAASRNARDAQTDAYEDWKKYKSKYADRRHETASNLSDKMDRDARGVKRRYSFIDYKYDEPTVSPQKFNSVASKYPYRDEGGMLAHPDRYKRKYELK